MLLMGDTSFDEDLALPAGAAGQTNKIQCF